MYFFNVKKAFLRICSCFPVCSIYRSLWLRCGICLDFVRNRIIGSVRTYQELLHGQWHHESFIPKPFKSMPFNVVRDGRFIYSPCNVSSLLIIFVFCLNSFNGTYVFVHVVIYTTYISYLHSYV